MKGAANRRRRFGEKKNPMSAKIIKADEAGPSREYPSDEKISTDIIIDVEYSGKEQYLEKSNAISLLKKIEKLGWNDVILSATSKREATQMMLDVLNIGQMATLIIPRNSVKTTEGQELWDGCDHYCKEHYRDNKKSFSHNKELFYQLCKNEKYLSLIRNYFGEIAE